MRRRERDEVARVARQRLELLGQELAGLRPERAGDLDSDPWSEESGFLDEPVPLMAGPPGDLPGARVLYAPPGRALPPEPARVSRPGRHAVDRSVVGDGPPLRDQLLDRVRGQVALGPQHVLLLVGVLGAVLVVVGWLALRHAGGGEEVPRATFAASSTAPSAEASGLPAVATPTAGGAGTVTAASAGMVVVDVAGKVVRPGLVTLPAGSRVNDAITRAGGAKPGAATTSLNLARVLVDGEQIVVGRPAAAAAAAAAVGAAPAGAAGSSGAAAGALVNLNTAGLTELDSLPGVGPVTAQKILDWRTAHGAFSSVDELLEVDGIGDKTLADITPRATL